MGASHDIPDGWMRAEDVVPWRQSLALAFTNPGPSERRPVIMFDSEESLSKLLEEFELEQASPIEFYEQIMASNIPEGVVSREINSWIDIDQTFYLMPILDHVDLSSLRIDGDMRGVQLASLTTESRSQQQDACDLRETNSDECIREQSGSLSSELAIDVVFVLDMTASMQPYMDALRKAIRDGVKLIEERFESSEEQLKFGLVGYRDVVEMSPGIEFVANDFTPNLLNTAQFSKLFDDHVSGTEMGPLIIASQISSGDFQEEVFAGLETAINANWSLDSARVIVLIGDASSHPLSHPKNTTGLDENSIRELADHNSVYIASIFVGDTQTEDFPIAKQQFQTVATGDADSNIAFSIASGTETTLEVSVKNSISNILDFVSKGDFGAIMSDNVESSDSTSQAILSAVRAAFVDYLGSDAQPPSNVVAWALDRDPTDYSKKAFDIKLMIGRKDMEELKDLLQRLVDILHAGTASSTFVFAQVQSGSTASAYDLGIENTDAIAQSNLVPKWIASLPYKSEVLTLTLDEFTNASADDRNRFETRMSSLIDFYDEALNRPDGWILLNEQASVEDRIYMLDIANLP